MVLTPSTMLPLGTAAPHFALPDVTSGALVDLHDFDRRRGLVVMFLCNHCPYVKHVQAGIADFARDHAERDLAIVAVSSNDAAAHRDDAPAKLAEQARTLGWRFPYLYDESQAVARAYRAACTPDFFLFDAQRALVYRGQFDGSRPKSDVPVTGADLRAAVDALLAGRPVPAAQKASLGCNIKWRPGHEP